MCKGSELDEKYLRDRGMLLLARVLAHASLYPLYLIVIPKFLLFQEWEGPDGHRVNE